MSGRSQLCNTRVSLWHRFLFGIADRKARFVIREHALLPWEPAGPARPAGPVDSGRVDSGRVGEQPICIPYEGRKLRARRIRLELDRPMRNGDNAIIILTNLPAEEASAEQVARLYGRRWKIEHTFQELAAHLDAEINTLGYPKAALFGFAVGFVACNMMSVVGASLRSVYGAAKVEEEISGYYIATELSNTYQGLMIAIPKETWSIFADCTTVELAEHLREWAGKANLARYRKHRRGPKKPPSERRREKRRPHVSTAKLIAQRES